MRFGLFGGSILIFEPNTNMSGVSGFAGLNDDTSIKRGFRERLPALWSLRIMPRTIGEKPAGPVREFSYEAFRKLTSRVRVHQLGLIRGVTMQPTCKSTNGIIMSDM